MVVSQRIEVIRPQPSLDAVRQMLDAAALPSGDLTAAHMQHFFFCGAPARPTGIVGLELFGAEGFLRSLVVAPDRRSTGLGTALVEHAERYARASGIRSLYLLTTTVPGFFARLGYAVADRAMAPPAISTTQQFAGLCPASATFMVKSL
jgi:amino-acid N-acetyltransferase